VLGDRISPPGSVSLVGMSPLLENTGLVPHAGIKVYPQIYQTCSLSKLLGMNCGF